MLGVLLAVLLAISVEARRERTKSTTTSAPNPIAPTPWKQDDLNRPTTKTKSVKAAALKERVDEAVEKVKAKSREQRMESEKKRVERKLRRDQKKLEKELSKVEPLNPHNLKMPNCEPQGMVYNGRRCVPPHKMRV